MGEMEDLISDLIDGDDDVGDDETGDDVGARRRRMRARRSPARKRNRKKKLLRAFAARSMGGGNPLRDFLMPFPQGTFAAAVPTLSLPAQPQKRFLGERLVIDFGRVGATATGLVTLTSLSVGVDPQFVVIGSVPARAFDPFAVGTRLRLDGSEPGILITTTLAVTPVPGAADTIVVSSACIGPTIG